MVDFTDLSALNFWGAGLALAAWLYFFFLCVGRSRAAGIEFEEPVLALYSSGFKAVRWILLPIFVYVGLLFHPEREVIDSIAERAIPFGLAAVVAGLAAGALAGILALFRFLKARREDVVYEPLPKGKIFGWAGLIVGGVVALAVGPALLESSLDIDVMGQIADIDLGALILFFPTLFFFWVIPRAVGHWLEDEDVSLAWARSTGLELFRWTWAGLVFMAAAAMFSVIPPLAILYDESGNDAARLDPIFAFALCILGPAAFGLLWVMPMRSLGKKAADGDYIANELLPRVRFSGFIAGLNYRGRAAERAGKFSADDEKHLCMTCLRPINDLGAYRNFRFDACPHCGSFIPPVFTMLDYVKNQSARLMPMLEAQAGGKVKKKRARREDEGELIQDLLRSLIAFAVSERATDVHLTQEGNRFIVRCRTDGMLYPLVEFSEAKARPLISSLKVHAELDIAERRKPQDGRFNIDIGERKIDIRVNTSPVADGEMAAMRLLYRPDVAGSIQRLGMNPRCVKLLSRLISHRNGLILVTGPTGSGKSTTLYNALEAIATGERNIITLEDPIEYEVRGLTQMQVNEAKGFTFTTGLRTILRQDPDVIMIGEIRDTETAKMAIDAAATGHLVFTTLHATDTINSIGRLNDLGVELNRVTTVMLLTLAQRLVRLNCPRCAIEETFSRQGLERQGLDGYPEEEILLKRGEGCPYCHETGYYGREGVYEFFVPDDAMRDLIGRGTSVTVIRQQARSSGMRTLLEDGLVKVLLGRTTLDEVIRVTS